MTVVELNERFNKNFAKLNARIEENMQDFDLDYVDSALEVLTESAFKKSVVFVEVKNGKKNPYIACLGNSSLISKELKELGFVFGSVHPAGGAVIKGWNLF